MKRHELTKQDLQLLCDLVQDAQLSNEGKFGPINQRFEDDLRDVRDKLWDQMDWADV